MDAKVGKKEESRYKSQSALTKKEFARFDVPQIKRSSTSFLVCLSCPHPKELQQDATKILRFSRKTLPIIKKVAYLCNIRAIILTMDPKIRKTIIEYFKTKPIEKAWVFGSYSRGEEHPDSDVDILITFVPGTKMGLAFFGMICDLEVLLHRSVDLVIDGDLLPFAEESVNRDKILVYERAS